ncbi:MAG: phosphoglycerate kinase [Gemmataceae bacterium]
MPKKTINDLPRDLTGKKVLARFDLNVGIDEDTGEIRNDRRIRAALPTLQNLLSRGAAVIAMSHLGRPKPAGDPKKNAPYRMDHVAKKIGEYLKRPVEKANDVAGPDARAKAAALKPGQVLVLENVRFDPREQPKKDSTPEEIAAHDKGMAEFAGALAGLGDIYVNDAFGTLHNKDVSVLALPKAMKDKPRVIGLLVEKELKSVDDLLSNPKRPMLAIMGGAKVSDKINFIKVLLGQVDKLLIGGAMTYTFMLAKGQKIGSSKAEADKLDLARDLLQTGGNKIILPTDHLVADKFDKSATTKVVVGNIPDGWMGMDIGPATINKYEDEIRHAATVVWNGPMGLFEWGPPFADGTQAVAHGLKVCAGTTIVGGGETAEAVEEMGMVDDMSHVSTGGGAFLKYVEDRKFKTLDQIEDR